MNVRTKLLICFLIASTNFLAACGGTKKKEIAEPTKNPGSSSQPTNSTGAETSPPTAPEFDPNAIPSEPDPTDTPVGGGEKTEEKQNGELTDETATPEGETSTLPTTESSGTGTSTSTDTATGQNTGPTSGSNPLTTLVALIQNPQEGMKTLLATLIGALKGQSSGGNTGSLISSLLGGPKPTSADIPVPTTTQQTVKPAAEKPAVTPDVKPETTKP